MVQESQNNSIKLTESKRAKKDEFYTQLDDIEKELIHYSHLFKDKVVYCNCDDVNKSQFYTYFSENFEELGLKKLITSCFREIYTDNKGYWSEFDGNLLIRHDFKGSGDFRGAESIQLLSEADIVVTNPPFSLFREYVAQLIEHDKDFLILGNINAVTYKDIFPLFKSEQMWYGYSIKSGDREFEVPSTYPLTALSTRIDEEGRKFVRVKGVRWFTNMDYNARYTNITLDKVYTPTEYPFYDNYRAINVGRTRDIPRRYSGVMGVPISFLDRYNPEQFTLLGADTDINRGLLDYLIRPEWEGKLDRGYLNNKRLYSRILIEHKKGDG